MQRTGSPIGDLSRNYASFAKLVAFKLSFCIPSRLLEKNLGFGTCMGLRKNKIGLSLANTSSFKGGCNLQIRRKKLILIHFSICSRHAVIDKLSSHCGAEKTDGSRLTPISKSPRAGLFNQIELA